MFWISLLQYNLPFSSLIIFLSVIWERPVNLDPGYRLLVTTRLTFIWRFSCLDHAWFRSLVLLLHHQTLHIRDLCRCSHSSPLRRSLRWILNIWGRRNRPNPLPRTSACSPYLCTIHCPSAICSNTHNRWNEFNPATLADWLRCDVIFHNLLIWASTSLSYFSLSCISSLVAS